MGSRAIGIGIGIGRFSLIKSLHSNLSPSSLNHQLITSHSKLTHHLIPLQSLPTTQNPPNQHTFSSLQAPKFYRSPNLYLSSSITFPYYPNPNPTSRHYSSFFGSNDKGIKDPQASVTPIGAESNTSDVGGNDLTEGLSKAWKSAVDAAAYTGQKAQEASDGITPYVQHWCSQFQHLLQTYPYLQTVVIPVCWTLTGTMLAWLVMPRVLRKLHKYSMQGSAALLSGVLAEQVPYEKSFWSALEDPVRYLVTFMAFMQLVMIVPTDIATQYIAQAWRGAVTLSFVWFLHRWKTNIFARALINQRLGGLDRENLLTLDRLSSVGLLVVGLMASAEACGVASQSILTVGGIGGAATAFASKDILGNVLSGLFMQFSKPFSLGDTIKVGSIEGQVVGMGLTTTSLLNAEKFPVTVPNSLFPSQVIVNKSRAQWRGLVTKIPLKMNDLVKIPVISEDIKAMLKSNPKVFLGKEAPYCFLSRIENSYAELTVGCNLKQMSKDELYSTQQDILLHVSQIIKNHGVQLGNTGQDPAYNQ